MARVKFATQVEADLLRQMRALARNAGRHLQALVDDAFADYLKRRHQQRVRPPVMAAYEGSHARYAARVQEAGEIGGA